MQTRNGPIGPDDPASGEKKAELPFFASSDSAEKQCPFSPSA